MTKTHTFLPSLILLFIFFAAVGATANAFAQGEAGGGRIPTTPTKPKEPTTPKTATVPKRSGALDNISGKWWTTGNDFGPS